jgi:hypothetical protein
VRLANLATQMRAAEQNPHELKFAAPSAVTMFGILRASRNARVAKSQQELALYAVATKMNVQHAHRASTTTRHRLARHVPVAMMHQLVVHHVLIKMKHQLALVAMMLRQVAPAVTKHLHAHLVSTTMRLLRAHHALAATTHHQHAHLVPTKTKHQLAHLAPSAKKCMRQSLACRVRSLRLNA